jgi:nucleoside-diphosphate-sugar epimerase
MRILILGGTRFIGPYIVRRLSDLGCEITLFHRNKTEINLPNSVEHILGNRQNLLEISDQLKAISPQLVLDMFPVTEQDALDVMNIFKGIAERVVAISSQDVYRAYGKLIRIESGPVEQIPLNENSALRKTIYPYRDKFKPDNKMYHYDKILVERVYMGSPDLPGTILRYPMVYGPYDYQHRLFQYLKRMDDNRPAILLEKNMADWSWSKGYVENVAEASVLAITEERATNKIYNVGEEESITEADWIKAIAAETAWAGKVVIVPKGKMPEHMVQEMDLAQHLVSDTIKIREELGFSEPVSPKVALQKTINWERANPPKQIDTKMFDYKAEDALLEKLK